MRIELTKADHWLVLLRSAVFLSIASVVRLLVGPHRGRPRIVLFEAVHRPTLWNTVGAFREKFPNTADILVTSFERAHLNQLRTDAPFPFTVVRVDTLSGALAVARSHVGLFADRPRTLGIVAWTRTLHIVDVWHGISFKPIKRPSFLRRYDEVWVASGHLQRIYEEKLGVSPDRLKVLGHSPLDSYAQPVPDRSLLRELVNLPVSDRKVVVFATTWNPRDPDDSLPGLSDFGSRLIGELSSWAEKHRVDIVVRNHHISGSVSPPAPHIYFRPQSQFRSPVATLQLADVLVTDWSSLSFEYAMLRRPMVFVDTPSTRPERFLVDPAYRPGDTVSTQKSLFTALTECVNEPEDYVSRHRETFHQISEDILSRGSMESASETQAERLFALIQTASDRKKHL